MVSCSDWVDGAGFMATRMGSLRADFGGAAHIGRMRW